MEVKQDKAWQQAIGCLPPLRAAQLAALDAQGEVEELRLRAGYPPSVRAAGEERALDLSPVTAQELREVLSRAARYSVHSYAESLRHGFVTLAGGTAWASAAQQRRKTDRSSVCAACPRSTCASRGRSRAWMRR